MTEAAALHRHCNAFARERDAKICWLLDQHPVTAAMLVRPGFFPSKKTSLRRLNRLVARKKIRLVGTVCRKSGRPEHVFGRQRLSMSLLLHEIELTELCFRLDVGAVRRGPSVTDRRVLPDAEIEINGQRYYLELDRGSMRFAQIEQRFRLYEDCPHFSLWVCSTSVRVEGFRRRAGGIRRTALFTTFAEALTSPHGEIWMDYRGERVALPREEGRKGG